MPEFSGKKITNERLQTPTAARWKSLALYRTQVDDAGIIALCEIATKLQEVHIQSELISDAAMPALCGLPALRSLLVDDAPQVTDAGIAHVARISQLRELYLNGTGLTDAGINPILGHTELWSLNLKGTRITDAGVQRLGSLPKLRIVHLDGAPVEGWGLAALPDYERLYLYVAGCPITDASLAAYLATHEQLEIISLSDTRITDASLPALAALRQLGTLWLDGTAVTDDGLRHLLGHRLGQLYLRGTAVSAEMAEQLKSQAPRHLCLYR